MRRRTQFSLQAKTGSSKIFAPVLVSACLLGIRCRYDGTHSLCPALLDILPGIYYVPICPEQLGGLPTPRSPATIVGGDGLDVLKGKAKVINESKKDVTSAFLKGAEETFKISQITGANVCLLKKKSPSCGLATPYCEAPERQGLGVTAALLLEKGLNIWETDKEDSIDEKFLEILKI